MMQLKNLNIIKVVKNAEKLSKKVISIPVHEFVSKKQLDLIINKIQKFYN